MIPRRLYVLCIKVDFCEYGINYVPVGAHEKHKNNHIETSLKIRKKPYR